MHALEPVLHACHACGACCRGTRVRLIDDEPERILAMAEALGVAEPISQGRLRAVDGVCVFLGPDSLCEIHRRFGAAAKPAVCRQYPLVLAETEAGDRVGVDPGCFSLVHTWRGGAPPAEDVPWLASSARRAPDPGERAVLALLGRPGLGVQDALAALVGGAEAREGVTERLIQRVRGAGLDALLSRPETGPSVRDALLPVIQAITAMDQGSPHRALDPETDAFAVAMVRRQVYLRLASTVPMAQVVALLGLGGAALCARVDPAPDRFGPALAAWLRALRAPLFWTALLPDPDTLRWLVGA